MKRVAKKDKIKKAKRLVVGFVAGLLIMLLSVYVGLKIWSPHYGSNISINYYVTLAGILPVLLVALFLTNVNRRPKSKVISGWWLILSEGKTEALVGFTVAEVACLIAIAINQSMTSLFVASLFGALIMVMITFRRIVYGNDGE